MRAGEPNRVTLRRRGRPRYAGALTPRQRDVFELLVTGLTNEEIAQHLGITPDGVKYHVSEILQRLGVDNRHDAVALHLRTQRNGWLAAWAPVMFLRKLPFAWLPKAAAGAALITTAAGIALLAWGVMSTSTATVTTTGRNVEQSVGNAARAPRVVSAALGMGAITAITAGSGHTCALRDGGVTCWGSNDGGQLGNNSTTDSPVPVAVLGLTDGVGAITAGSGHTCALKDGGGVWCWGWNSQGQLGNDGRTQSPVPVPVLGLGSGVSAISASAYHTCALKDGGVWCWGSEDGGELGNNGTTDGPVLVAASELESGVSANTGECALRGRGVWCWGYNPASGLSEYNSLVSAPVSGLESGVSAISAIGLRYGCAIKGGGVWCWAYNLINSSPTWSPVAVAVPGLESGVSAISAGSADACALKDGGVWCWGGYGLHVYNDPTIDLLVPAAMPGLVSGVSALSGNCALKDDGVWCWGSNSTTDSPVPVPVLFTPPSGGDIAAGPDAKPLTSQPSIDSADHRAAYVLGGTAAAALAIVAAGVWVTRRRRSSKTSSR